MLCLAEGLQHGLEPPGAREPRREGTVDATATGFPGGTLKYLATKCLSQAINPQKPRLALFQ